MLPPQKSTKIDLRSTQRQTIIQKKPQRVKTNKAKKVKKY